jgi:hypothetical protein
MGIISGGVGGEGGCGNLCSVKISCILGIALQTCRLLNSVDEEPRRVSSNSRMMWRSVHVAMALMSLRRCNSQMKWC